MLPNSPARREARHRVKRAGSMLRALQGRSAGRPLCPGGRGADLDVHRTVPACAFTLFRFSRSPWADLGVRPCPRPAIPPRGYSEGDVWPPRVYIPRRHCANGPPRARGHGRASSRIGRQDIKSARARRRSRPIGRSNAASPLCYFLFSDAPPLRGSGLLNLLPPLHRIGRSSCTIFPCTEQTCKTAQEKSFGKSAS